MSVAGVERMKGHAPPVGKGRITLLADRRARSRWALCAGVGIAFAAVAALPAEADVASDKPAAIVVFPKLLVDTANGLNTFIRLSNTSDTQLRIQCYYVNTTPHCDTSTPDPNSCFREGFCASKCNPQWNETDFQIVLTARQPTGWLVSDGLNLCAAPIPRRNPGVCSNNPSTQCDSNLDCGPPGSDARCVVPPCLPLLGGLFERPDHQKNEGSIPVSPEDPFIGELKCIALDETGAPTDRNDLKGEALIGKFNEEGTFVDVGGYNAIGIPAIPDTGDRDNTLVLGGDGAEYDGCPNVLILNHFFDGAIDPIVRNICQGDDTCSISGTPCVDDGDCVNRCVGDVCTISRGECQEDLDCPEAFTRARIATDLTLIPCTQDFRTQNPKIALTPAQMLVFNEFEQRFSTSISVNCFKEIRLSNMETVDNERSIFAIGIAGTLTGQTRIRGVITEGDDHGNTLIGIAEEFRCRGPDFPLCSYVRSERLISSAAFNLHFYGTRPQSDFIYLP